MTLAPLGLALAPALMRFAETAPAGAHSATESTERQCVRTEGAPVHERFRGSGDVQDHLGEGTEVQIVEERKNWRRVSYASGSSTDVGWMTMTHLGACEDASASPRPPKPPKPPAVGNTSDTRGGVTPAVAGGCGPPLSVKFYDVGQALSALLTLPDGRRILVDTGEMPNRPGCGAPCKEWSSRFLSSLRGDVSDKKLAGVWITHQHSDHAGNAPSILREFTVATYVDNGTNLESGIIKKSRDAAEERNVPIRVIDPDNRGSPFASASDVKLTPILPTQHVVECEDHPNDCSIGLRLDYCSSSVLFTGDAEEVEEAALDPKGDVTLLQVGHHGSDTSSSDEFLDKVKPKFAVVSSAKRGEGTNGGFCHPRLSTVEELSKRIGGRATKTIEAFDAAVRCKEATDRNWHEVPVSDRMWFTARDGDVELVTTGDGTFTRRNP